MTAWAASELHNPDCIGCGSRNPASAGFEITAFDGKSITATCTFTDLHTGAPGVVHGGMVATVLDELMGRVPLLMTGHYTVTAAMELAFRAPALVGVPYTVSATLTEVDGRKYRTAGELAGDHPVARATALFILPRAPSSVGA